VLRYLEQIPENIELPANFRILPALPPGALTGEAKPKIVTPPAMAGEGKIPSPVPGAGEDLDKKLAAYKQRVKAHTDAIKQHLTQFIDRTLSPPDDTCVTTALIELGFERQIDLHGEEDAQDLIERCFRRVVRERRGPLQ